VEFAVLTDAISIEIFEIKTQEHKNLKGLGKSHSLRDNMTPIELTLTTLGEQATTEIAKKRDVRGMVQNLEAARRGGNIAKVARLQLESETGIRAVSNVNYLTDKQKKNLNLSTDLEDVLKIKQQKDN